MSSKNILDKACKMHFVGIGGSGMCPIAEILMNKGFEITGSDIYESDTLQKVRSYGVPVFLGHKKENIGEADVVVYSAAIKKDNPELLAALEKGIPMVERSVMLGMLTKRYRNSIAVSGTHGKTTTTGMITQILTSGNMDPTAIIGGMLPSINGNSRIGNSDVIVCEACEYVNTYHELTPAISVILNIDADHLDFFGNLENVKRSFNKFASQTTDIIVINGDDKNTLDAVADIKDKKIVTFGLSNKNDYYAENIQIKSGARENFSLIKNGEKLFEVTLGVPGEHNIYNALAAAVVADYTGVKAEDIANALHDFKGVHRRFEILGCPDNIVIADDFAHHPTELTATLNTAIKMGFNNVWAVFQPHTYSRTFMFLDDFAKALSIADKVVLAEILAVRETNTYNVFSEDLAEKIDGCVCLNDFESISDYICKNAKPGDLVLTIGGGNIYKCADMIIKKIKKGKEALQ